MYLRGWEHSKRRVRACQGNRTPSLKSRTGEAGVMYFRGAGRVDSCRLRLATWRKGEVLMDTVLGSAGAASANPCTPLHQLWTHIASTTVHSSTAR